MYKALWLSLFTIIGTAAVAESVLVENFVICGEDAQVILENQTPMMVAQIDENYEMRIFDINDTIHVLEVFVSGPMEQDSDFCIISSGKK